MGLTIRSNIETLIPVVTPWHFFDMYSLGSIDVPRKQRVMVSTNFCEFILMRHSQVGSDSQTYFLIPSLKMHATTYSNWV